MSEKRLLLDVVGEVSAACLRVVFAFFSAFQRLSVFFLISRKKWVSANKLCDMSDGQRSERMKRVCGGTSVCRGRVRDAGDVA